MKNTGKHEKSLMSGTELVFQPSFQDISFDIAVLSTKLSGGSLILIGSIRHFEFLKNIH